jgi:hypothetical protein
LSDKIEEKRPKGENSGQRRNSLRLNAITATIAARHDSDSGQFCPPLKRRRVGKLSTYSHYPQRERKKEPKKERETAATIL